MQSRPRSVAAVAAVAAPKSWMRMSGAAAAAHLSSRVQDLRRVRMIVGSMSGLCWGVVAFVGTLLAWVWTDLVLDLPPALRILAWWTALVALVVMITRIVLNARAASADALLARQMDAVVGSGGQIQSGLDPAAARQTDRTGALSDGLSGPSMAGAGVVTTALEGDRTSHLWSVAPPLTSQLADIAVRTAASLADTVSWEAVAPVSPLIKASAAAAAAAFVVLVAVAIGPRMAWTEFRRFVDPYGDHPAWSQYEFTVTPETARVL